MRGLGQNHMQNRRANRINWKKNIKLVTFGIERWNWSRHDWVVLIGIEIKYPTNYSSWSNCLSDEHFEWVIFLYCFFASAKSRSPALPTVFILVSIIFFPPSFPLSFPFSFSFVLFLTFSCVWFPLIPITAEYHTPQNLRLYSSSRSISYTLYQHIFYFFYAAKTC